MKPVNALNDSPFYKRQTKKKRALRKKIKALIYRDKSAKWDRNRTAKFRELNKEYDRAACLVSLNASYRRHERRTIVKNTSLANKIACFYGEDL